MEGTGQSHYLYLNQTRFQKRKKVRCSLLPVWHLCPLAWYKLQSHDSDWTQRPPFRQENAHISAERDNEQRITSCCSSNGRCFRTFQKHNKFLSQLRNRMFIFSKPSLKDIIFLKWGCTQNSILAVLSLKASDLLWLTYLLLIRTVLTNVSVSERTTNQTLNGKKQLLVLHQHHLLSGPPAQSAQSAMSSHPHPPSAQLAYRQWVSWGWVVNQIKCCFPCVLGETHVALVTGASKMASRGKTLGLFSLFSWSGSFVPRCFVFSVRQGVSCHCSLQLNSNRTACASFSPNSDKALCAV